MFAFRRFERSTTLFIGLLLLSFLVATFDVRADGTGVGEALREGTQALFTPLQKLADARGEARGRCDRQPLGSGRPQG